MNTNTKLVAAKYRALPSLTKAGKYSVYMFCFNEDTGKYDTAGSCISRTAMTREKAEASAAKWQAKENASVDKENKLLGF